MVLTEQNWSKGGLFYVKCQKLWKQELNLRVLGWGGGCGGQGLKGVRGLWG